MPTISEHDALPTGTRLGEFEIQQVLGIGGFGIVYLAFDHALERQVAIKEYMPAALASRGFGAEVTVRSAAHADTFMLGMRSFINEARLLARFDHPSLVKVYRFWEQHGTAYMVMPYYKGRTLQEIRRAMKRPPDEAWLRQLITPLLGALDCLHRENVYHRDVAPDNILLLDDETGPGRGRPVLLDLGAARRVIGDHTQTLTAIVKPSFAPIEQYAETVQLRQGPWTDLYALAAVVHFCITGRPPMPATARAVHDDVATLRQMSASLAAGFDCHFSQAFARAIDHALAVRPQDRPESVAAWLDELHGSVALPADGEEPELAPKSLAWMTEMLGLRADGTEGTGPDSQAETVVDVRPGLPEQPLHLTTIPAAGRLHAPPSWPSSPSGATAGPVPVARAAAAPAPLPPSVRPGVPPMSPEAEMALRHVMADTLSAIPATVPIARPAGVSSPLGLDDGVGAGNRGGAMPDMPAQMPGGAAPAVDAGPRQVTHPLAQGGLPERASSSPGIQPPGVRRPTPPWLGWGMASLALTMGLAIWWTQRHGHPEQIVSASEAAGFVASPMLTGGAVEAVPAVAPAAVPAAMSTSAFAGKDDAGQGASAQDSESADKPDDPISHAALGAADRPPRQASSRPVGQAVPLNPRRACGDRSFILLAICMKRYCSRPEYTGHAECVRMRQQEERQRENYYP